MIASHLFRTASTLGLILTSTAASASYPAGVWILIDKAEVDIGKNTLTLQGVVSLHVAQGSYTDPAEGTLHYTCLPANAADCAVEWPELVAAANIGECRGFGAQNQPTGTLYPPGAALGDPDPYPIGVGVVKGFVICEPLSAFKPAPPPPEPEPETQPEAQPEVQPEAQPEAQPDPGPEPKPEAAPEAQAEVPVAETAPEPTAEPAIAEPAIDAATQDQDAPPAEAVPVATTPPTPKPDDQGCQAAQDQASRSLPALLLAGAALALALARRRRVC
jgi:MYXO-CTERM domain-containing protein